MPDLMLAIWGALAAVGMTGAALFMGFESGRVERERETVRHPDFVPHECGSTYGEGEGFSVTLFDECDEDYLRAAVAAGDFVA